MAGVIRPDVVAHIPKNSAVGKFLQPFLELGFSVTWARERRMSNTPLLILFLEPDDALRAAYSFKYEVLLAYNRFDSLQPRVFQAINGILNDFPARGRVENLTYFLVSGAGDVKNLTRQYVLEQSEARIPVAFSTAELCSAKADAWTIRTRLAAHFSALDRFKNLLPLRQDTYYFGRSAEFAEVMSRSRRGQNTGVFGLRKTGKTSLLLKVKRSLLQDESHRMILVEAQSTAIRKRRWNQLLEYLLSKLSERAVEGYDFSELSASDDFSTVINNYCKRTRIQRVVIAIDEIEFITPKTAKDAHWNTDYLEFWHCIRSHQTSHDNLSIIVSGVNPSIAEVDTFDVVQNPLFGIVGTVYLAQMTPSEIRDMVSTIGKVMGLKFDEDTYDYLIARYGGHPLLTRLACSYAWQQAKDSGRNLPFTVRTNWLRSTQSVRDEELTYYSRHVVSELQAFYHEEYLLLTQLAIGDLDGFISSTRNTRGALHLFRYGIIADRDVPYITCEVVQDYVAREDAQRTGRATKFVVVPPTEREAFTTLRLRAIMDDLRSLERLIRIASSPLLFGPNSFPMADKVIELAPPRTEADLGHALTTLHQAFGESIDNYGKSESQRNYFFSTIQSSYPYLHRALHRIRVYRHDQHHLFLTADAGASLQEFLTEDMADLEYQDPDRWWVLFQRCLDALFRSLQIEIDRTSMADSATNAT